MDVKLVAHKSGGPPQSFQLKSAETIVGRQKGCGVRIPSGLVSRQHCLLSFKEDLLAVEDLSSANGTFINGRRIAKREFLRPGDKLKVGPVTLLVQYQLTDSAVQRLLQEDETAQTLDHVEVVEEEAEEVAVEVLPDEDDTSPLVVEEEEPILLVPDEDPLAALRELEEKAAREPPPPKPTKKTVVAKPKRSTKPPSEPPVELEPEPEMDDVETVSMPPPSPPKRPKVADREAPTAPAAQDRGRRPGHENLPEGHPDASMILGGENWELPTGEDIRDILSQIEKGKKKS